MLGATVKLTPLLDEIPTVTTTFPVFAAAGTRVTTLVELQLVGVAAVPLNVMVLDPWIAPKFDPLMVTDVPVGPDVGESVLTAGTVTVKENPLLDAPNTVTTTLPLEAPLGTSATIWVVLQLVGLAAVPSNVTVLDPWVEPKFTPVIVTDVPMDPDGGESARMPAEASVKFSPLLGKFETVTRTFPEIAPPGTGATICVLLQLVGVVVTPLKATVLDPCVEPKFVPAIVTEVPAEPDVGDKLVRVGAHTLAPIP
jgi:hypothetical protein